MPSAVPEMGILSGLRAFLDENGLYLLLSRLFGRVVRAPRNLLLARRLSAPGLHLGRCPRILGLNHMSIGRRFAAGDFLWLQAVTRYGGQRFHPALCIGDNVGMGDNVHIGCTTSVSIGDDVLVGSRVTIIDHNHGIYGGENASLPTVPPGQRPLSSETSVSIGKRVWIGDGAVILPGAQVGDGSIIGANAVVTGLVPEACVAAGCPARPIRKYDPKSKRWVEWPNSL